MNTHNRWTDSEIALLKKTYPTKGRQEIYCLLPYRSHKSIDSKANRLHLKQPYEFRSSNFDAKFLEALTEATKAYIAGFFDGEGTIHIVRKRKRFYKTDNPNPQLFVACTNTNKEVINYLHDIFNGSIFLSNDTRGRRRACYRWSLYSFKASQFLELLLPYLIVKKTEAQIAIEFQTTFKHEGYMIPPDVIEKRNYYASQVSELKGRIH